MNTRDSKIEEAGGRGSILDGDRDLGLWLVFYIHSYIINIFKYWLLTKYLDQYIDNR